MVIRCFLAVQMIHTEGYDFAQQSNLMNVLHVDDSPEICQLYADMLSMKNHNLESITDGRKGLELALKNDYDLILLDVCMPGYSGMEFIHDLKAKRPSELKKIIIVSVLELSESHKKELLKLGIHSVEEKPATIQKLETIKKDLMLRKK
ncbi:MAG TPA: response regulator [Nitrosopumilaceae archaeon]|nr:response regulator [Nitrosopumilaceae archaeon]